MKGKYLLGIDVGSSSIKAALVDINSGKPVASAFSPSSEMSMLSVQPGFAEQDPMMWWNELLNAIRLLKSKVDYKKEDVSAIGISYQMHGLVCIDKNLEPLRPSIIWCDSRAVEAGNKAFESLGANHCLCHYLNSPGNFTASKLYWVKKNEPELYDRIYKILLPGDFIALKITGIPATTISGLSEGIFWDYIENGVATDLLNYYGIDKSLLADIVPTFGEQGRVMESVAEALHVQPGVPVSYRAGDQPNNAYSLNVLEPGEVAATAGTSGVVYGITDQPQFDQQSRVNAFVHVNYTPAAPRYGILMCVNGTGSLNSWMRQQVFDGMSYEEINKLAATVPVGSDSLQFYPFGNGAERVLANADPGSMLKGLQFNRHKRAHLARAAQEGIVFALNYGMSVMTSMGMKLHTIRAGYANMFLSDVFASTFANTSGCSIELYNTDGAVGAARAAGVGTRVFNSFAESFRGMEVIKRIDPNPALQQESINAYENWKQQLNSIIG
jgi:xylulokinase